MNSVKPTRAVVNHSAQLRGRGQPSKQTAERVRHINRVLVQAALTGKDVPSDAALAEALQISERTIRAIRLDVLGLNRHELHGWHQQGVAHASG
jgi:hypothetical protein